VWWFRWRDPVRTILDIDDVEYLGAKEAIDAQKSSFRKLLKAWRYRNLRSATLATLDNVGAALVCSPDDARSIAHQKVHVIPNVFPDRGQLSGTIAKGDSKTILFVGALVYKPNREGVQYFIQKVLPLIRAQNPQVRLQVVGKTSGNQSFSWINQPGVEFLGTVDELDPIISNATIEICPILQGLGTRIKILEALSFGKPVVYTTKGAYGIGLGQEAGIFRADSPSEMASVCLKLINDPTFCRSIGEQARREVVRNYSQAKINELMRNTIFRLLNGS
ncbi:glycosyltransferase, partial [bacterium]|nr:glycosyltransferase [bacterium]